MFGKLEIFQIAHSMAGHASARQSVLARNIANADTPGYRASDIADFDSFYADDVRGADMHMTRAGHLSGTAHTNASRPRLIFADAPGAPNGNSVSLELEMMKATRAKGAHDLSLAVYKSALGILRTSLGRG